MAQQAMMSTEAFEDFFFKVCNLDYSRMEEGSNRLAELMTDADEVAIKGNGTNLRFSMKGFLLYLVWAPTTFRMVRCFPVPCEIA